MAISILSSLSPISERESSADIRSVNQKGKENFVQNSGPPRSGYRSARNSREASDSPAVRISSVRLYRSLAAIALRTTPVTIWEKGFERSGGTGSGPSGLG